MAANYWESTQRKYWQFTKLELFNLRQKLEDEDRTLVDTYTLPQLRHISIFFNSLLKALSKRLNTVRQQALATAQLYLRRFYTKIEIRRTNPYLLVATALYLACKTEEAPQHIRVVLSECRTLWPEFFSNMDTSKIGECEFFLISEMNSQMIIHQPYRSLTVLAVNDHYMTDLPLLYAPHIIALTAILLVLAPTTVMQHITALSNVSQNALQRAAQDGKGTATDKKSLPTSKKLFEFKNWLSASTVDIEAMIDACQEMISFYEVLELYSEKTAKEQIVRFIKGRNLDK